MFYLLGKQKTNTMITFYQKYAFHLGFSQNGEEGILKEIFKRIGIEPKLLAEWGCNDGEFCSNTRHFIEEGAKGIWIEYDEDLYLRAKESIEGLNVDLYNSAIDQYNVNDFIPLDVDMVSLDTDGRGDYDTWKALKAHPPVVVIEINSGYLPMEDRIEEGANYSAMVKLGISLGYFLVCHTGNLIFVGAKHRDKFPDIVGDGISNHELYFLRLWQ